MDSSTNGATERLRLRGLRFLSDNDVELEFEGIGVADVKFVATRHDHDGIPVITFNAEFARLYLGVPCLGTGTPYATLVGELFAIRDVELPAGPGWQRAYDDCVAEASARFDASRSDA